MLEEGKAHLYNLVGHNKGCLGWCPSGRGDRMLGGRHCQVQVRSWDKGGG